MGYEFIAQFVPMMPDKYALPLLLYPNYGLGVTVHLEGYRNVELREMIIGIDQIIPLYDFSIQQAKERVVGERRIYSFSREIKATDEKFLGVRLIAEKSVTRCDLIEVAISNGSEKSELGRTSGNGTTLPFVGQYNAKDFPSQHITFEVSMPVECKSKIENVQLLGVTWSRNSALWSQMAKAGYSHESMHLEDYDIVKTSDRFQHYLAVERGFITRLKGRSLPGWEKFENGVFKPN